MNKCEYCQRLADIYAASRKIEEELREVKLKLFDEENPDKRNRYNCEVERLLRERGQTEEARKTLSEEGYSDSE